MAQAGWKFKPMVNGHQVYRQGAKDARALPADLVQVQNIGNSNGSIDR